MEKINWEEWIIKNFSLPSLVCNGLLFFYSIFITTLTGIFSIIQDKQPSGYSQKVTYYLITNHHGKIICIAVIIIAVYCLINLLIYIAKQRLTKNSDFTPCIRSLLITAKESIRCLAEPNFDITIFKAEKDGKNIVFFASSDNKEGMNLSCPISTTTAIPNSSEIQECWFNNKTVPINRESRKSVQNNKSTLYDNMQTVIALPIIVFPKSNKKLWGIVCIRVKKKLASKQMVGIVGFINDGMIINLEALIETQHLCNHFIRFY